MKQILFITVFFTVICGELASAPKKNPSETIFRDMALWKVGQEIYFHSDLKTIVAELKRYRCLNEENKLLPLLGLSAADLEELRQLLQMMPLERGPNFHFKDWPKLKPNTASGKKLNSLLLLLMLVEYTQAQKIVVNSQVTGLLEKAITVNRCPGDSKLGKIIEKFLRVEVFLRSRFHRDSFWVTPEELAAHKDVADKKALENQIKESKAQEALKVFLDSISKQISHEVY